MLALALVAIVGSGLLLTAYLNAHIRGTDAKVAATVNDLLTLKQALIDFKADCHRYPKTSEGLAALMEAPPNLRQVWKGPYLCVPMDSDPWGHPYEYTFTRQDGKGSFQVKSYGPSGGQAAEDDAANIVENGDSASEGAKGE